MRKRSAPPHMVRVGLLTTISPLATIGNGTTFTFTLQLKIAKLMAIAYALLMCLVLISIFLEITKNWCSPSSIFFFSVAGIFLASALFHPQVSWWIYSLSVGRQLLTSL